MTYSNENQTRDGVLKLYLHHSVWVWGMIEREELRINLTFLIWGHGIGTGISGWKASLGRAG